MVAWRERSARAGWRGGTDREKPEGARYRRQVPCYADEGHGLAKRKNKLIATQVAAF